MAFPRLVAWTFLYLTAAVLHAQTLPVEYATFMSHGKAVSCALYDAHDATATIIYLRGSGPSDLALGRMQARFFSEHGFRVLLADYLTVTPTVELTAANYRRWAQAVQDIVAELRSRPVPRNRKIAIIGQGLGASVALLAGSRKMGVDAIAEWSGLLPNQFFPRCRPCRLCSSFTASRISRCQSSTPASLSAFASSGTSPAKPVCIPTRATSSAAKRQSRLTNVCWPSSEPIYGQACPPGLNDG